MSSRDQTVEIEGLDGRVHHVPAEQADRFRNGRDGSPLTDAEWDEQERRLAANNDHLIPEEFRNLKQEEA